MQRMISDLMFNYPGKETSDCNASFFSASVLLIIKGEQFIFKCQFIDLKKHLL